MLYYGKIQDALGVKIAIDEQMESALLLWKKMYMNQPPWLDAKHDVRSCGIASAVASEIALLTTAEARIDVTGGNRGKLLKRFLMPVITNLSAYTELAAASGGIVFKPYPTATRIAIDVVQAGEFFPVRFDSAGDITAAIFPEYIQHGEWRYTRLEYHDFDESTGFYRITNRAFKSKKRTVTIGEVIELGIEIALSEVREWEQLAPETTMALPRPLFSYLRTPLQNNISLTSPLGISFYARAVEDIRDADEQYGKALWEYTSKETAVQAGAEFFQRTRNGDIILPKGKERLYTDLGDVTDRNGTPFFNVYSPEIRHEAFWHGLSQILRRVEFNSRLAYGTLSDAQDNDKTAEEIRASKQRSYVAVKQFQNRLYTALDGLCEAMDVWLSLTGAPAGTWNLETDFDDSLIQDKESERATDRADVAMGVMPIWEYRMKWYKESEEVAKAKVSVDEQDVLE